MIPVVRKNLIRSITQPSFQASIRGEGRRARLCAGPHGRPVIDVVRNLLAVSASEQPGFPVPGSPETITRLRQLLESRAAGPASSMIGSAARDRTQACRLRVKLLKYYATEGFRDPVIVSLPLGHYIPLFQRHHPSSY